MNSYINRLIAFALANHLISEDDKDYAVNLLLDLFHLSDFHWEDVQEIPDTATPILAPMLEEAVLLGLVEDHQTAKDLFDGRIMNTLMPRPSEVIQRFFEDYQESPQKATDNYYALSIASNYIRKSRTDKNIRWKSRVKYGEIEISINLSKPEKDPKAIIQASKLESSHYPTCLLCKENVGFAGDYRRDGRLTHRIIPLSLENQRYYLQYSPYVYYNEHCIVFNEQHTPMAVDEKAIARLLDFVTQFPHYMLGSNAGLPIVGGSILSHDHYQGGRYHFPIQDAQILDRWTFKAYPDLSVELLSWPLTTIRLTGEKKQEVLDFATSLWHMWQNYTNEALDIVAYSDHTPHNAMTPIARRVGDLYQLDVVLRNNATSETYPDGIFHPHKEWHHIKKENIGLIEVMGLAILPGRLKNELAILKACLLGQKNIEDEPELEKHRDWYETLKTKSFDEKSIDGLIAQEVADIFCHVLEDAGVFKLDDNKAHQAVKDLIEEVGGEEQ